MSAVIDASALLCVLLDEPGADEVFPSLRGGLMSAVNLSESCSRGAKRGVPIGAVLRVVTRFELVVVPFDTAQAEHAARLREGTRRLGISLGDRACLTLGKTQAVPVLTADRRLADIDPALGIDIRLIR